ncbi:MAG: hypothetical protein N2690_03245 [Rhodocyclaceae bacterium]|nr:hypothetical protein [Rhodocyclaceae bacterium]
MMPSCQRRLFCLLLAVLAAGCTNVPTAPSATGAGGKASEAVAKTAATVIGGPLIPNASLSLSPSVAYPLENLVFWGGLSAAAWLILDPLAPNWEIRAARFPENHIHFHLAMKRYYAGGAGEARTIFHRRAKELMRAGGFTGYEVIEYREGLDSSVIGSQRTAEGVIRLVRQPG